MKTKKLHIHACGCIHLLDYFCGERPNKTDTYQIDFIEYQDVDESKPDLYCQECLLSLINASEEVEKKVKLKP